MDAHHVIEAAGIIAFGLAFYSYARAWLDRRRAPWLPRAAVTWLAFGAIAVVLMISRIDVDDGVAVDARLVPIALIALVEGAPAALVAATAAAVYRVYLGGGGMAAGLVGIFGTVLVSWGVAVWARRDGGGIRLRHTVTLSVAVYAVTALSFAVLGGRGLTLFARVWHPLLFVTVAGIGVVGRLISDIAEAQAAETARRESEAMRAVTSLARAAAHEINNPLMVVTGALALLSRHVASNADAAKFAQRAQEGAERITEIVGHMTRLTHLERMPEQTGVPEMLDIRKSSEPPAPPPLMP